MELPKAEKSIVIEDGKHTGKLLSVENKKAGEFDYTYFNFDIEGAKVNLSAPTDIKVDSKTGKPTSKLAKIISAFGVEIKEGEAPDVNSLIGKDYDVVTVTTEGKNNKGKFAKIVSVKGNSF